MNALARAYIDGIHDRFAQSLCLFLRLCVCVFTYVPVHGVQQVCTQFSVYVYHHVPVHDRMSVHVHRILRYIGSPVEK